MTTFDRKAHWEEIYLENEINEVSWYQATPSHSLHYFEQLEIPLTARIIDVGGGDSLLVDHLLDKGYQHLTVLDISEKALEKAKKRVGERASLVNWIVADIATFEATNEYDVWHDRAAFHFLTDQNEIAHYVKNVSESVAPRGWLLMGTFSDKGPTKCSGIPITQYTEVELTQLFSSSFTCIESKRIDHHTPFDTVQNFLFCSFQKH